MLLFWDATAEFLLMEKSMSHRVRNSIMVCCHIDKYLFNFVIEIQLSKG